MQRWQLLGGTFLGPGTFGPNALTPGSESDGFLASLDADGNVTESHALGASQRGSVVGLVARVGGGYLAVGSARGKLTLAGKEETTDYDDGFVLSVDGAGVEDWWKLIGTNENDEASSVALAPNGHLLI